MKPDAYERTLRARAFDISRYLLPLATNTSLGEIVNARTLETPGRAPALAAPSRSPRSGRAAEKGRHFSGLQRERRIAARAGGGDSRSLARTRRSAERELLREVRVAPTLVKYADPNLYEIETRRELQQAAAELMRGAAIEPAPLVDLLDADPLEIELATTLLYGHCHYSYRQIRQAVEAAGEARRREIIDLGLRHRGKHDELPRSVLRRPAVPLRHPHGHRRLPRHAPPPPLRPDHAGLHHRPRLRHAAGSRSCRNPLRLRIARCSAPQLPWRSLPQPDGEEARENAQYAIPLAFRKRTLFKMDFAEAVYISELRTTPAGHASYRNVAYAMYEAVAKRVSGAGKVFPRGRRARAGGFAETLRWIDALGPRAVATMRAQRNSPV